ncbi:GNAT family N-acetyltransferase [Shimia abyssi]|uniref:N-acetylglutamate synthase-like GNAT family acetyltransferase n=1 Tax=Shimia abyssi TaxID=1662395 RepID=A0A2P8FBJ2_9RHOB|nr:GNAT family N-acetyltransferase [Shimia abyssi]PSL19079.1 N-acetylglutamate synthase-like GNAT family acetyltransferase [Shimia abyssi]
MTVRRATLQDADALAQLIDGAYQGYRDRGVDLPDVSGGVADAIADGAVWVIGEAAPVGVLMLSTKGPDAHLMNIAVSADAQGQGVGGKLIRHAMDQAREAGCKGIALATHVDLAENIALYEHLGWSETGREGARVMMYRAI